MTIGTNPPTPSEAAELKNLLLHFGGLDGSETLYRVMDSQLAVLHSRAQSLVQLVGVVITVTGFSGRIIADTNEFAQFSIITGLAMTLLAAAVALIFVMPIRWLTSYMDDDVEVWLLEAIRRRKRKSAAYLVAIWILIIGMVFYVTAISVMLLYPEAAELQKVR